MECGIGFIHVVFIAKKNPKTTAKLKAQQNKTKSKKKPQHIIAYI
jgi:hypothetical protein